MSKDPSDDAKSQTHLLVDGGVSSAGRHPDLLVEMIAEGIGHVDGRVRVGTQNHPERRGERGEEG